MGAGVLTPVLLLLAAARASSAPGEHAGEGHCPWAKPWEWAGVFHFEAGNYTWNAEKAAGGSYAEETMKLLVLLANASSAEGLEGVEAAAEQLWNGTWAPVSSGAALAPGGAYVLSFDSDLWISLFRLSFARESDVAFFAEHLPAEFERSSHYLKAVSGQDVEASAEESSAACSGAQAAPSAAASNDRWGEVIGASVVTTLPSLLGIAAIVLTTSAGGLSARSTEVLAAVNAGASGVIFAAAVFLLLPEAHHLAAVGHEETWAAWTWGTCILAGWLFGAVIHHCCSIFAWAMHRQEPGKAETVSVDECGVQRASAEHASHRSMASIAGPVIFGDLLHNLADGFVLGVAFRSCGASFAWKLAGISVAHEVPQELADFVVLIGNAGMKWWSATLVNFLSALAAVAGALIAYGSDISSNAEGLVLAGGAGVYLYVATTELGPAVAHIEGVRTGSPLPASALRLLSFVVGAVLIGLILLDHEHCDKSAGLAGTAASSGAGAHAGHNHRI